MIALLAALLFSILHVSWGNRLEPQAQFVDEREVVRRLSNTTNASTFPTITPSGLNSTTWATISAPTTTPRTSEASFIVTTFSESTTTVNATTASASVINTTLQESPTGSTSHVSSLSNVLTSTRGESSSSNLNISSVTSQLGATSISEDIPESITETTTKPSTTPNESPKVSNEPSTSNSATTRTIGTTSISSATSGKGSTGAITTETHQIELSSVTSADDQNTQSITENTPTIPPATPTEIPDYEPPTTTIDGPTETSESVAIAPLFIDIWRNRDDIQDEETKEEYIESVKQTEDDLVALFNNLEVKPDPEPECDRTSMKKLARSLTSRELHVLTSGRAVHSKRSLITGILDKLDSAAKLLRCGVQVIDNLVDSLVIPDPPISVIETLTDTLKEIGEELENQDDEPTSSEDLPSTTTTEESTTFTSSCTESSAVPSCAEIVSLSTHIAADGSTSSSSIETITTTSCTTITGCEVTATTDFTTVSPTSTTTSSEYVCSTQCASCLEGASRRRSVKKSRLSRFISKRTLREFPEDELDLDMEDVNEYIVDRVDHGDQNNDELDWNVLGAEAVSKHFEFGDQPVMKWVEGVEGCTVITIVSERGMWFSHLMEPGFMDRDQYDKDKWAKITNAITNGERDRFTPPEQFAGENGMLNPNEIPVEIFISTPQKGIRGQPDAGNTEQRYLDKISELKDLLVGVGRPFEGVEPQVDTYRKPADERESRQNKRTARFKVLFEYDDDQHEAITSPATTATVSTDPKTKIWRVWNHGKMHLHKWRPCNRPGSQKRNAACPISPTGTTMSSSGLSSTSKVTTTEEITSPTDRTTEANTMTSSIRSSTMAPTSSSVTKTSSPISTSIPTVGPIPDDKLSCASRPEGNGTDIALGEDAIKKICDWRNVKHGENDLDLTLSPDTEEWHAVVFTYSDADADATFIKAGSTYWFDATPGEDYACGPASWNGTCDSDGGDSVNVLIGAKFADGGALDGCKEKREFAFPSGDYCESLLGMILNDCQADTPYDKNGGTALIRTDSGCMEISINLYASAYGIPQEPSFVPSSSPSATSTLAPSTSTSAPSESLDCSGGDNGGANATLAEDAIEKICGWKSVKQDGESIALTLSTDESDGGITFFYNDAGYYVAAQSEIWLPPSENDDTMCGPWAGTCIYTSGLSVDISALWDENPVDGASCKGKQDFEFPSGNDCVDMLRSIVHGCDTDTTTNKHGGSLKLNTENGCVALSVNLDD